MRFAVLAGSIALAAALFVTALALLATGKAYVFGIGPLGPPMAGRWWIRALGLAVLALGSAATLHAAAHRFPRRYYDLIAWRDRCLAFGIGAGGVAVVLGFIADAFS